MVATLGVLTGEFGALSSFSGCVELRLKDLLKEESDNTHCNGGKRNNNSSVDPKHSST